MGFVVDFSEFERYCKQYAEMQSEFEGFLRDFLTDMAWMVIKETKPKTPYRIGLLRNSWNIGNIHSNGKNLEIEIINTAEYATEVEFGHRGVYVPKLGVTLHTDTRWTNGHFMMTTSIENIQKQMPAKFEQAFQNFLKEHKLV